MPATKKELEQWFTKRCAPVILGAVDDAAKELSQKPIEVLKQLKSDPVIKEHLKELLGDLRTQLSLSLVSSLSPKPTPSKEKNARKPSAKSTK